MALRLEQLLDFEGKIQPINFKTNKGLLIWPVVRYPLFRYINDFYSNFESFEVKRKLGVKAIRLLFKVIFQHNGLKFLFLPHLKYLYFGSGVTNIQNTQGKYHNRVSDDLLLLAEKESFILEQYNSFDFKYPRTHEQHAASFFFDVLYVLLIKLGLIRLQAQEVLLIDTIIRKASKTFDKIGDREVVELKKLLSKQLLKAKAQYFLFSKLFYLKKPRIIFVEDASYGTSAFIIKAAKKNGIKVGEIQHGFVGRSHMAYNYSETIAHSSQYQQYLPDYFLTYGNFWSEEINLPSQKVVIGKPSIQIDIAKECSLTDQDSILFVSSGNTYQETKKVLLAILNGIKGSKFKLLFRPHPLEANGIERKYGELLNKGMLIDRNSNVYDSISKSGCIIGDISTVLFEALAFNNKLVISYRSLQNPQVTFPKGSVLVVDIEELNDLNSILNTNRGKINFESEQIWSKNWQVNFRNFLKSL